jgi:RHS repeat-associated protein
MAELVDFYFIREWVRVVFSNGSGGDSLFVYGNSELLARKDGSGNKYYYHPDHLGSTTVITKQDGSLDERISYLPYGLPRQTSQELYQYTGQEWESDFGFYDYDARQYNPTIMRFMQADKTIPNPYYPQALNRYSDTFNNPLKYSDPNGNNPVLVAYGIGSWVGLFKYINHQLETGGGWNENEARTASYTEGATWAGTTAVLGGIFAVSGKITEGLLGTEGTVGVGGTKATPTSANLATSDANTIIKVYNKGAKNSDITVIGRTADNYVNKAESLGGNYLDIDSKVYSELQASGREWEVNKAFLDNAMKNGNEIVITSDPSKVIDTIKSGGELKTPFEKEVGYLIQKGYKKITVKTT